uniref:Uncharacterized protein n=1 Tax=Planktothrix agardhii TaxID=1160 RepID=A0A1J1JNA2_PLAAG|nr:protein of unknown function [Planktothrix agardhii]
MISQQLCSVTSYQLLSVNSDQLTTIVDQ